MHVSEPSSTRLSFPTVAQKCATKTNYPNYPIIQTIIYPEKKTHKMIVILRFLNIFAKYLDIFFLTVNKSSLFR